MTIETNSFMLKGTSRCVAVKTDEYKGKDCWKAKLKKPALQWWTRRVDNGMAKYYR